MRKKNFKGRCEKRCVPKCEGVAKTYGNVQSAYLDALQASDGITKIQCNVPLEGDAGEYATDFLCIKADGGRMVRECESRSKLSKPMTLRLLDLSRSYWRERGIEDWGVVVDAEE